MADLKKKARELIDEFKGESYIYGLECLGRIGEHVKLLGRKTLLITGLDRRNPEAYRTLFDSLARTGLEIKGPFPSARPNSPKEDVRAMKRAILGEEPDLVLAASGGSGIDAAKAAVVLAGLEGDIEDYFGAGKVSEEIDKRGKNLLPLVAIQTASGSAAHLTKYSNITDFQTFQKKLIIDEAIIPVRSLFDYSLTQTMSSSFTLDGAFDGLAHCLEVYYGAGPESFDKIEEIALTGIDLIVAFLKKAIKEPSDLEAREALGLATDLGGYAIMIGGTNGAHLTSFSLVDILSHGRACAILNPYYTVLFAPSIQRQLEHLSGLFIDHGLMSKASLRLSGQNLGLAVAEALITLSKSVDFPTNLEEIKGMTQAHIEKALQAAKGPQLETKLKNMPIPMTADTVDEYMKPVLQAALTGDFALIKTV